MPKIDTTFVRRATIEAGAVDTDARRVRIAISSEAPTREWFGEEVLEHNEDAIDLSRAANGLAMLWNHNHDALIGRVRDIGLDADGVLRGDAYFDDSDEAEKRFRQVQNGTLTDVSVGGERLEWKETERGIITTRWAPIEASLVAVGKDPSVGVNRSNQPTDEGNTMPQDNSGGTPAGTDTDNVLQFEQVRRQATTEGEATGRNLEFERCNAIREVFKSHQGNDAMMSLREACLLDVTCTVERARQQALDLMGTGVQPMGRPAPESTGTGGPQLRGESMDELDKFGRGMREAMVFRGNLYRSSDDRAERQALARQSEFFGMSVPELARTWLRRAGVNVSGKTRMELVGMALVHRANAGTSDFTNILADVANLAGLIGWEEAPENWDRWAAVGNLSDFKPAKRAGISSFDDLEIVAEDGEVKRGKILDTGETIQLATYAKSFGISRKALVNDSIDELTKIPRRMFQAASRTVGNLAYAVLTANGNLSDGNALFSAAHNNLGTAGALSMTTVGELRKLMRLQKDRSDSEGANALNVLMSYLIVPVALEDAARTLMAAQYDPAATAGTLKPNEVQGAGEVVADARLDLDSATQFYAAANPNLYDTVEVAFLDGVTTPTIEQEQQWTTMGTRYRVHIDAGAAALGYQGVARNAGA